MPLGHTVQQTACTHSAAHFEAPWVVQGMQAHLTTKASQLPAPAVLMQQNFVSVYVTEHWCCSDPRAFLSTATCTVLASFQVAGLYIS